MRQRSSFREQFRRGNALLILIDAPFSPRLSRYRKREARRERDPWLKQITDPGEFSDMDRRKHRILDVLFKALEKRGGKAKEGERAVLYIEMQSEKVEFQIREKQKKGRRPLSESEQRWADKGDKGWRQAMQPTGAYSTGSWAVIPREGGQPFHGIVGRDSTPSWAP